ncbi:MAG: diguanylate cyclase [Oscillospiraceae bacterium]
MDDDIRNISKLSSATIGAGLDDSLEGPIFVSRTMAGDLFLKDWLQTGEGTADEEDVALMKRYLSAYSEAYGYTSVFLVSAKTGAYYNQDGLHKTITPDDPHDVWYYKFLESGKLYDLDVDYTETRVKSLAVFVNCRVEAEDGTLLGVAGVAIPMSELEKHLKVNEESYDVKAFLMDAEGTIQVDSILGRIESANFFSDPKALAVKDRILNKEAGIQIFWKSGHGSGYCLVSQYLEKMDWYLIVEKNAETLRSKLSAQMRVTLAITFVIIAVVLLLVTRMVGRYNRFLLRAASMDGVTGLPNNKMFRQMFNHNAHRYGYGRGKLFIFDIDNFKNINDTYGHMSGNAALSKVARVAKDTIGTRGIIARWGGDEFVGVVYGSRAETENTIRAVVRNISTISNLDCKQVTISIGATALADSMSLSELLHEADAALYSAKSSGKDQAVFFQDLEPN